MSTSLTIAARRANTFAALREHALHHLDEHSDEFLTDPRAFHDWCGVVLEVWHEHAPDFRDRSLIDALGRNTAYKLFRELSPAFAREIARRNALTA